MAAGPKARRRTPATNADSLRDFWMSPPRWAPLIVVPWVLGVAFGVYGWSHARDVARRQVEADGVVTRHDAANHDAYLYVFQTGGRTYQGRGYLAPDQHSVATLRDGAHVTVYVDGRDPTTSALTRFESQSDAALVPAVVEGVAALLMMGWLIRRRRSAERTSPT